MPATPSGSSRSRLYLVAVVAAVAGVVAVVIAILGQQSPPEPTAASAGQISVPPVTGASSPPATTGKGSAADHPGAGAGTSPTTTPQSPGATTAAPLTLAPSQPTSISIPAIGVRSEVISIGKNPDGTLAVPQPGPNLDKVAWYRYSATPGAPGPSVLEGHVDTTVGPSIFYRLGAVTIGDHVSIARRDGSTAVFTVNAVRSYATHADFPVAEIFADQLSAPTLRLITCSNFDSSTRHYLGNTVVFAHLTRVLHP